MITIGAIKSVPEFVQGYVRDVPVRWALEELALPYEVRLYAPEDRTSEKYLKLQPFGQVPIYEENGVELFECGSIVLHIAEKSEILLPKSAKARGQVLSWMFAAMNTIDPWVRSVNQIEFMAEQEWAKLRKPGVNEEIKKRLLQLAHWMKDRPFLTGHFSAADILMTTVLRNLDSCEVFLRIPLLVEYVKRCESRPAFQKALSKHLASFRES